jgi:Family of unknown function (DUF6662)
MKRGTTLLVVCAGILAAMPARADEPLFGFVYSTDLLPKKKFEMAQWLTWRAGKAVGDFDVVAGRTELEYGVTSYFQLSAYFNYEWANAYHNNVIDGSTLPPETLAQLSPDAGDHFNTTRYTGFALEGILRLMSPYTDPFGLTILIEPTYGPALRELETRLIFQKNFLDDRLVFAFNITASQEGRYVPGDPAADPASEDFNSHWDHETDINFGLAGSFRFAPNWSAGIEIEHEREFAGFNPFLANKATNTATYMGPTIHFGGAHFFATLSYLPQLPVGEDFANPAPGFIKDGINNADDFERFRLRLKAGYYF